MSWLIGSEAIKRRFLEASSSPGQLLHVFEVQYCDYEMDYRLWKRNGTAEYIGI